MRSEQNRLVWHILIWGGTWIFLMLLLLFRNDWINPQYFLYKNLPVLLGTLFLVIINVQLLLPKLYFKRKIGLYVIVSLVLFIGVVWLFDNDIFLVSELAEKYNNPEIPIEKDKVNRISRARFAVPMLFSFVGSTLVELTHFTHKKEKAIISIEKEKLNTEIKFLKSQINPHFLFNVLNNIYTLTVIKSDKAPENLMRLSEMLRYMLYDSNEGKVPLKKEIDYLENYIKLTLLKDSRGLNVSVNLDKSHPNLKIAPLLFIPFIENAFKHSKIEDLKNGFININLKISKEHLEFFVENSIPTIVFKKDKVGGIGLVNTKQRLDLLYPEKYTLNTSNDGTVYSVYLKLDLT